MSGVNIAEPDITLVLNMDGVIQDVTLSGAIAEGQIESWRGRPWAETVADIGGGKIARIVDDARRTGVSAFRQVNQRFPSGRELPIEYTTVRVGGKGGLLAIGRSLQAVAELQSRLIAAQQAMEQDYWKLREVETRYRLLFDASIEAVLLLKVDDLRITEANRAAVRALGVSRGSDLLAEIVPADRDTLQTMLARTREQGRARHHRSCRPWPRSLGGAGVADRPPRPGRRSCCNWHPPTGPCRASAPTIICRSTRLPSACPTHWW